MAAQHGSKYTFIASANSRIGGGSVIQLSADGEKVLRAIFAVGQDRALGLGERLRIPTPGPTELYALCELIASFPREEDLQLFLENNPGFLTSLVGTPDNADLAVLFKPPVGTQYRADFCVLQAHQGGSVAHLIEIETSHEALFTKKGNPTQRYAAALNQVENWRIWINKNAAHYSKELVRQAQGVPLLTERSDDCRGVRLAELERLHQIWSSFGGFEHPVFSYTVVMGRWSELNSSEKERVITRNRHGDGYLKTFTYEQVARLANFRLERDEWNDENQSWRDPMGWLR